MAYSANSTPAPSRRQFFGSAAGAGLAAAYSPIFTVASASALAILCDQTLAIAQALDIPGASANWEEKRWMAALDEVDAVYVWVAAQPSQGLSDIKAKARLALNEFLRSKMGLDNLDPGEALAITVLREIAAFEE